MPRIPNWTPPWPGIWTLYMDRYYYVAQDRRIGYVGVTGPGGEDIFFTQSFDTDDKEDEERLLLGSPTDTMDWLNEYFGMNDLWKEALAKDRIVNPENHRDRDMRRE